MQKTILYTLFAAITLNLYQRQCLAQSALYSLDINKSKLFWAGTKTVGTKHVGYILFKSGTLNTDAAGKPVTGDFIIDMKTMRSTDNPLPKDNQKVNDELGSDSFFSVDAYPETRMKVTAIRPTGVADQYTVAGNLTIKGITWPINFLANIKPAANKFTATAEFKIDRLKWNIHHKPDEGAMWKIQNVMISDEIPIRLKLEFGKN